jgi:hypothetical protein
MSELFCTPEQGKRLKELLPELTSYFMWVNANVIPNMRWISRTNDLPPQGDEYTYTTALTLQELRDVALGMQSNWGSKDNFSELLWYSTAPELAEWVIARLEEAK